LKICTVSVSLDTQSSVDTALKLRQV
jgi:hypothetical protein